MFHLTLDDNTSRNVQQVAAGGGFIDLLAAVAAAADESFLGWGVGGGG